MKPRPLHAILGLLLTGALQATPLNPDHVPDRANWFLHADLDQLRDTSVGGLMMEEVEKKHGKQLRAVKRMFSLNPFSDLHGVTLWGPGEKDQAAVVIKASFDREHLTDLISAAKDHETSAHHEQTVHSWKDDKEEAKTQHGAFFGEDLVVISEQKQLVLHTLDVLDGRADAMDTPVATEPASFLLGLASLEDLDIKGDDAELFRKARSLQARFHERNDRLHAELTIEAAAPRDATRFAKVLEGIVALGELGNEKIAGLELEHTVTVKGGTTVHASLSIPSTHVLQAMEEAGALGKP